MHVWVVDDNSIFRTLAQIQIKKVKPDVQVSHFEHGELALKQLEIDQNSKAPNIILLDINMPVMNGWEFMSGYDELDDAVKKNVDIYIVTSSIDQNDRQRAEESPYIRNFLVKPLQLDKLQSIFDKYSGN